MATAWDTMMGNFARTSAEWSNATNPRPASRRVRRTGTILQQPTANIGGGIDPETKASLERAMAYYKEGGGYGKGVEAGLERGRVKSLASGMQSMVSAGLSGTTMPAGLGKKYQEEVAMPARAKVEETRAQAISGLEVIKAQITQGATEAARSRALQQYLAKLQSSTQLELSEGRTTSVRTPSITPQGVQQPAAVSSTPTRHTGTYPSPFGNSSASGVVSAGAYQPSAEPTPKPTMVDLSSFAEKWLGSPMPATFSGF